MVSWCPAEEEVDVKVNVGLDDGLIDGASPSISPQPALKRPADSEVSPAKKPKYVVVVVITYIFYLFIHLLQVFYIFLMLLFIALNGQKLDTVCVFVSL